MHSSPASRISLRVANRAAVVAVPNSTDSRSSSSMIEIDNPRCTVITPLALTSRSRSRRMSGLLVRMEKGTRAPVRASMIPGMSW